MVERETTGDPALRATTKHSDRGVRRKPSLSDKLVLLANMFLLALIIFGFRLHGVTVALLLAMPWILAGIVAYWPNLFSLELIRLGGFTQGTASSIAGSYLLDYPLLYWFLYVQAIGWTRFLLLAGAVGLVLFCVSIAADATMRRGRNWLGMAALLVLAMFHGYVTVRVLNVLMDGSSASVRRSVLVTKSNRYTRILDLRLTIKPWGPVTEVTNVSIPYPVYRSIQPGDAVCLVLREGAIGIPWYTAQICPWDEGAVRLGATP